MNESMLLIGGSGQVKGSVKGLGIALKNISVELDGVLKDKNWSDGAPFNTLSLIVRYGEVDTKEISVGRISKKYSELEASIQTSLELLRLSAKDGSLEELVRRYSLLVINEVSKKYGLQEIYA